MSLDLRPVGHARIREFCEQAARPVTSIAIQPPEMRITDLERAVIGDTPVVRLVTDDGISGHAAAESYEPYLQPHGLYYKPFVLDEDPAQVEQVMLNIRHRGSFKPWGSAVSTIEMALRDLAGKAAGRPVHRTLPAPLTQTQT